MQLASPASILFSTLLLLRIAEATPSTEGENVTSSSTDPTTGQLKMTPTALTVQYKTSQTTAAPPGAQTSEEVTTANPKANVSTTSASEESVSYSTGTVEQLEGHVPKTIGTATTGSDETTHTAVHHHTAFSVPGTSEPEGTKQPVQTSDKRVLWCLAPVLAIVVAALAYAFKSKLCKSPMYPDTTENGTENASYQSRPENSKDGVMLLGVKSGGEDNAAAR